MSEPFTIKCTPSKKSSFVGEEQVCLHCDGAGLYRGKLCKGCNGHGVVYVNTNGSTPFAPTPEALSVREIVGAA